MAPPPTRHPPRPGLAFRVGVVGHRWNRLPRAAAPAVRATVATVLGQVRGAVVAAQTPAYRSGPPDLRLVTALAEGADRLAAMAALDDLDDAAAPRFALDLIFPFGETAYRASFETPGELEAFDRLSARAARTLVMDGRPDRFDAFVAGGRAVVDHCDVLIAVWDLGPADGAGGTANQVSYAAREEVPVIVIDPTTPESAWLYQPSAEDLGRGAALAGLGPLIQDLIAPPAGPDLRERYFAERHVRGHLGKAFRVMVDANQRGVPPVLGWPFAVIRTVAALFRPDFPEPYPAATHAAWLRRWADPPTLPGPTLGAIADAFATPFGWADGLASCYGHRYRSSFAVVFGLSWVAVMLAAVGALQPDRPGWGLALAGMEVAVLLLILAVVVAGRRGRFHERWLDYRALAERLRHLTFLWPLGRAGYLTRQPRVAWDGDPRADWTAWLVRAVVRETGMPSGTMDAAWLDGCRRFCQRHELAVQVAYHDAVATRLAAVQRRLHPQVELAFAGALVVALLHLVERLPWAAWGLAGWHYPVWGTVLLTLAAVVLPAFAASRHGFLGQADVMGTAMRSAALAVRLRGLQGRFEAMGRRADLESLAAGDLALETARLMEADLASWRGVFRAKPLGPA